MQRSAEAAVPASAQARLPASAPPAVPPRGQTSAATAVLTQTQATVQVNSGKEQSRNKCMLILYFP